MTREAAGLAPSRAVLDNGIVVVAKETRKTPGGYDEPCGPIGHRVRSRICLAR